MGCSTNIYELVGDKRSQVTAFQSMQLCKEIKVRDNGENFKNLLPNLKYYFDSLPNINRHSLLTGWKFIFQS